MSRTRRRAAALLLLIGLVGAACGSAGSGGPIEPAAGADPLLTGEFATLAGDTIDLAALQGEDVVLWFWAPW